MADKTTKILEVVVDNNKAIAAISEYNRLIDEQKAKQAALSKQFKDGAISEADYYKGMANSKEVVKTYKREVRELSKEMQNNIKIGREKEGALRALRAELSNMNKAYDSLSEAERNSEFGQNMQKTIDTLTSKIKVLEHNTGRDFRNVGNYISGVVGKLGDVASGSGSAKAGVAGLTMGFKALSSTGIGMVLTVVAKVLDAVIKNLKSSEENANRMAIALAPLKAGGTALTKVFQWLGGALATAAEWLGKMADRLGLVSDKMKEQQGIVKEDIEIQKEQRRVQMENADLELKVSQLKAKASEKDKYTAKERKAFLEESIALERKIADNNVNLARREYDIAKRKSELAGNSKEENDALADSYVNLQNAERDYFNKVKELNAQITEATTAARAKQKERIDKERQALAELANARVEIMKEGIDKERAQETANHEKKLAELRDRLKTEQNLSEAARAAINQQIELEEQRHVQKMAQLDIQATNERLEREKQTLDLKLGVAIKGSEDEFKLKQQQLRAQMEMELLNVKLTEEQKQLIRENYQKKEAQLAEERNAQILAASRLEFENQIAEMALRHENTLQTELQMKQAELDALHQLEGESDAEFRARQLAAMKEVADKKKEIADYEISIEQTKYEAISSITGALSNVLAAFGEENKAMAKASKVLALAEIAINTGKAIAAGVAQSQSVPFPANLAAVATTVTTVLANIASAISTVKSAKFATGGLVVGPGTGTSDSINARLSNGESVINARSTAMFGPLLSSLNQAGGGIAFNPAKGASKDGYAFLASAVASGMQAAKLEVAVSEIQRVETRVAHIKERSVI